MWFQTIFAIALGTAVSASAASPFDGRWVDDLKTAKGELSTDVYVVSQGVYSCESCSPKRSYPTDGKLRAIVGDEGVSEATRMVGPRSIMTRIVDTDMVRETTMTVSEDNKTATYISLDKWPGMQRRLLTKYLAKRVAAGPAGSHPVSGSWQGVAYLVVPEEYRSIDLKEVGDEFSFRNLRQGYFTARSDGPPVTLHLPGDDTFQVSLSRPDALSRVERVSKDGKLIIERTYKVSADGKSLTTIVRHPKDGSTLSFTAHKRGPSKLRANAG